MKRKNTVTWLFVFAKHIFNLIIFYKKKERVFNLICSMFIKFFALLLYISGFIYWL